MGMGHFGTNAAATTLRYSHSNQLDSKLLPIHLVVPAASSDVANAGRLLRIGLIWCKFSG